MVDSIVLKMNNIDTCLYIFYDIYEKNYHIRGNRFVNNLNYSFQSKNKSVIYDFVKFIMENQAVSLHSYSCLPTDSSLITYDILSEKDVNHSDNISYNEIMGYVSESKMCSYEEFKIYLKLLFFK
jgi:hypothetical protein